MSGSCDVALKSRLKASALTQPLYRLKTVFHLPKQRRKITPEGATRRVFCDASLAQVTRKFTR
jgi:hypothetical protein